MDFLYRDVKLKWGGVRVRIFKRIRLSEILELLNVFGLSVLSNSYIEIENNVNLNFVIEKVLGIGDG